MPKCWDCTDRFSGAKDFSDWVREHPGGPDKIQKWTTMGYVLKLDWFKLSFLTFQDLSSLKALVIAVGQLFEDMKFESLGRWI